MLGHLESQAEPMWKENARVLLYLEERGKRLEEKIGGRNKEILRLKVRSYLVPPPAGFLIPK